MHNEIQARRNEIQTRRNEIKISFTSSNPSFSMGYCRFQAGGIEINQLCPDKASGLQVGNPISVLLAIQTSPRNINVECVLIYFGHTKTKRQRTGSRISRAPRPEG